MTIENGPFVTSVKIGLKTKIKKDGQDAVTSSYKTFFSCKEWNYLYKSFLILIIPNGFSAYSEFSLNTKKPSDVIWKYYLNTKNSEKILQDLLEHSRIF